MHITVYFWLNTPTPANEWAAHWTRTLLWTPLYGHIGPIPSFDKVWEQDACLFYFLTLICAPYTQSSPIEGIDNIREALDVGDGSRKVRPHKLCMQV
jgi:hypothetical protein